MDVFELDGKRRSARRLLALPLALVLALLAAGTAAPSRAASAAVALSPQPGAPDASPATQISVLGADPAAIAVLAVDGSRSGRHSGRLIAYAAARGASFLPAQRFAPGERVSVRLRVASRTVRYRFTVGRPVRNGTSSAAAAHAAASTDSFVSRPDLHPPAIRVRARGSGAPGEIFVTPLSEKRGGIVGQIGPLILDRGGNVVWMHPLTGHIATDLRPQTYLGRQVLTWWEGDSAPRGGVATGEGMIMDSTYTVVARADAGNGYRADPHDFVLEPNGTALLLAYAPVRCDLSRVGGPRRGTVFDAVVQQVDVRTGLVMFEWHALGNIPLADTYAHPQRGQIFDPYHVNSVDVEHGGNLLVSMRNTWAAYSVNVRDGRIAWRLGGRHSTFALDRRARFAWQHDVHLLGANAVSIFDNEGTPKVGGQSRAIVLRLDRRRHRATLARQYGHSPPVLADHEGNVQSLPGGGAFVGWGTTPYFTELSPTGRLVLSGSFPGADQTYRAYLYPWSAQPASPPDIAIRPAGGDVTNVYASWNGATEVASWQVLAGTSPDAIAPVSTAPRAGFETAIAAHGGPYFAVRALGASGQVLGTSGTVHG